MEKYGILMYPSSNRVYFESSKDLSISELQVASQLLSESLGNISRQTICGVEYITFDTKIPLSMSDIGVLSRLSFVYALYKIKNEEGLLLSPVEKRPNEYFDDDIVTMQKYSGKTNETFTKMMVNIGLLSSDFVNEQPINMLDPICGRGTTLFQGLVYGMNVSGIEIDKKVLHQGVTFFTRYLKTKRYKHHLHQSKMSERSKRLCEIYDFKLAKTKDEYKEGKALNVRMVRGDTANASKFFKKNFFHLLVGDLPYGVQHSSSTNQGNFTRNPEKLLESSLPDWAKVLKKGGTAVLSWNTFLLKKDVISRLMEKNGFQVLSGGPYDNFEHRVDQAIMRDIIVGKKK